MNCPDTSGLRILAFFATLTTGIVQSTPTAYAIDLEAGGVTLSVNGNVNGFFLYTICDPGPSPTVAGNALMCQADDNVSSVTNGLLPATLQTSIKTTQAGLDLQAFFGIWMGSVANFGVVDFSGVDVRQVFLTFGNESIGTVKIGRDFGLFALDVVLNDMSLVGVGASAAVQSPLNTQLGGIGYGYIYADRHSQINYTTPSFGGLVATVGIFQPLDLTTLGANSLGSDGSGADLDTGSVMPGVQTRVAYNFDGAVKGFVAFSGFTQNVKATATNAAAETVEADFQAFGGDLTAVLSIGGFGFLGYGYYGSGIGTTGLFYDAADRAGEARDSFGGLAQVSYKFGSTKVGVNGGISGLERTDDDPEENLSTAFRITGGVYHGLTEYLQLVFESSYFVSENHEGGQLTNATFNAGAFLAF